ncbi:MAG: mechanosensitive ion channel family protein [Atopobiaceae bacterium]|nr:mechanosensitive ion channel family protein [Atopobiaceae bacterium]
MPILENDILKKAMILVTAIVIAVILQTIATRTIKRVFERGNVPKGSIFINIARGLIWFLALLSVLQPVFGVAPTGFVAALGVASIAVTLGMQDTIANVLAGLTLMFMHVFEVGDWIEVGGYQGVVVDITWRATTIRSIIGDTIVIPNSVLGANTMRKLSPLSAYSFVITLDIHPEVDMAEVERDVRESVEEACADYIDPELGVLLVQMGYGTFGFRLDVRVGIKSLGDLLAARSAAVQAVAGRPWLARW